MEELHCSVKNNPDRASCLSFFGGSVRPTGGLTRESGKSWMPGSSPSMTAIRLCGFAYDRISIYRLLLVNVRRLFI